MTTTIKAADLFCGAGGTSTGLIEACSELGMRVDALQKALVEKQPSLTSVMLHCALKAMEGTASSGERARFTWLLNKEIESKSYLV